MPCVSMPETSTQLDICYHIYGLTDPYVTLTNVIFGYAGCDTYLVMKYDNFGDSGDPSPYVYGLSPNCHPLGLSCLRKVEEIVGSSSLPDIDYYVLPQKLQNRCVTQQLCVNPTTNNQFYKTLGLPSRCTTNKPCVTQQLCVNPTTNNQFYKTLGLAKPLYY
ncbi:hypothetical protein J6590_060194 [Homalodisca vitripennis]|nr:hypothetical protein J6590_060194 [Homalodisca vitripennis]